MAEHPRYHTKFLSHLDALCPEPEDKLVAAEAVAHTMNTPGWGIIAQLLEDQMARELNTLVRHVGAKSKAQYAADLAELRGIQMALDAGPTVLHAAKAARVELSQREGAGHG